MKKLNIIKTSVVLAIAIAAALPQQSFATNKKGAELLMDLSGSKVKASTPAAVSAEMECAKCKTVYSTAPDTSKGAIKHDRIVAKHLCTNCKTTIQTTGVGRQAERNVVHVCDKCGADLAPACDSKTKTHKH